MSLIKVNKNENPYDVIGNYIEKHIPVIDDIIAVISIDGKICNELLLVDEEIGSTNNFVWQIDWWEGEENVELIDFFFVSDACKRCDNNDFISRQLVIDALRTCYDTETITIDNGDEYINYGDAVGEIEQLPPAQPDIVRCKNCKYWIPYDWMFSKMWQSRNIADYPEDEIGCKFCDMTMKANDFCSRTERREVTK